MTAPDMKGQCSLFGDALTHQLTTQGEKLASEHYLACMPLLQWLDYLRGSERTGNADELLDGLRASIIEAMGCVALGLVRPAIYSMRCQIDVALGWLYFKDHPVEWAKVGRTGDGFLMKKDALYYLDDCFPRFSNRLNALVGARNRSEKDPYWLLSAYVHAQSPATVPSYGNLETLIWPSGKCYDAVKMQTEVSEYISDVFISVFALKWASLPETLVSSTTKRLPNASATIFS